MNKINETQTETKKNRPVKAIWKKPQVRRLSISLDTAFFTGSNADATRSTP